MNIRKSIDYSAMFVSLDKLMTADLSQIELYYEIGRIISSKEEKGAAVAAAEYLQAACPNVTGFSPRNLRRMRAFYRAYTDMPEMIDAAMEIGWTQNVVILEARLTSSERVWYMQAAWQFGWSKAKLLRQIEVNAHLSLDLPGEVCYTEENAAEEDPSHAQAEDLQRHGTGSPGAADGLSALLPMLHPRLLHRGIYPQPLLVCGWRGWTRRGVVAYGKLFSRKAGLVSREWYPDLANYRRSGYDFDARYEEGLASHREKRIMDVLLREGPTLSKDLKRLAGFGGDGLKGFDTEITSLQMQTYITVHSFEYARDKHGKPYGWGIARYAVTEDVLGADVTQGAYHRDPEESRERIIRHLGMICPDAFDADLAKFIR